MTAEVATRSKKRRTVPFDRVPGLRSAYSLLPVSDHVMFEAWGGTYSDNPRAIFEALRRRGDDRRHTWVLRDDVVDPPEGIRRVRPGSREFLDALGRARHVVTSNHLPAYYLKRTRANYLQTWHGTPLKRIGLDIANTAFADQHVFTKRLRNDVGKWDQLISPNPYSSPILRKAFGFEGPLLETGYPRNDAVVNADANERARIRRSLGIGSAQQMVLYAPTWRDDEFSADGRHGFELQVDPVSFAEALGPSWVLVVRGHQLVAGALDQLQEGGGLLNATRYPDVRDLLVAADVLVTDYSSVMFDFAVTGRPIVLFTYDLAKYRDQMRGFYLDVVEHAPGRVVHTCDQLIAALAEIGQATDGDSDRYQSFRRRFCAWDDGHASDRVIDEVFVTG
jgi:CDP-glycerol glycerophosphotransferase